MQVISDCSFDSTVISQVLSTQLGINTTLVRGKASGGVDSDHRSGGRATPMISIQTADLATLLGLSNFLQNGLAVGSGAGAVIGFRTRADSGAYAGSGDYTVSCADGLLVCREVTIDFNGESEESPAVTAQLEFYCTSADGTDPLTVASATLSSASFVAQFAPGVVLHDSTDISDQVTRVSIKPQIVVQPKHYQGLVYPQAHNIRSRNPVVEITTENLAKFASSGGFGAGYSAGATLDVYMRRRANGGVFSGSSNNAKISLTGGLVMGTDISGQDLNEAAGTLSFFGKTLSHSVNNAMPS